MKLGKKEELLEILDRVASTPILVVGDMMLDRYVWGRVERISQEAPVPVVEVVKMEDRLGGAGNVVRNLATIGAKPLACGVVGDDEEGVTVKRFFDESGAGHTGIVVDTARPTVLKTRVIAHQQQVVRVDRESRDEGSVEIARALAQKIDEAIEQSRAVILSDYGKGAVSLPVLDVLHSSYSSGRLGLRTRPLVVDPHPRNYARYKAMTVAKPNRKEAEMASGCPIGSIEDAFRAADILLKKWNSEIMMITLGEDGMIVRQANSPEGLHLETTAQEVFDVSGAGDTVTAVYTAAISVGASPVSAGVLANIAAGIVVSEVGTAAINVNRLRHEVSKWEV